jgi:hypothetical protein
VCFGQAARKLECFSYDCKERHLPKILALLQSTPRHEILYLYGTNCLNYLIGDKTMAILKASMEQTFYWG